MIKKKVILFCLVIVILFGFALDAFALQWPNSPVGTQFIPKTADLKTAIQYFYEWAIVLGGLAAFIMLLAAGVQYLTSTGDPAKTKDARDRIGSAIGGLVLLLASFLLLNILNPELTTLRLPQPIPKDTRASREVVSIEPDETPCEKAIFFAKPNGESTPGNTKIAEYGPEAKEFQGVLTPPTDSENGIGTSSNPGSIQVDGEGCQVFLYKDKKSETPAIPVFNTLSVLEDYPGAPFRSAKVIGVATAPGSSGAPAPGQQAQCRGPGSYADSTKTSLKEAAAAICANNKGKTPLDADIHFFLASGAGPNGCTAEDVKSVRDLLLKSCGAAPGAVVGTIQIDQATVPATLCRYGPPPLGTSGLIYEPPPGVAKLISYVSSGGKKPIELLSKIQQNAAALVQHCSEKKNKSKEYCFLQDKSTQIGSFDIPQKAALSQYCYDIIP